MIATPMAAVMLETIDRAAADKADANFDDVISSLYESFPEDQDLISEMKTYANAYSSLINTIMTMDYMMADYARSKLMKLLTSFRENIVYIAAKLDGVDVYPPQLHTDDELMATLGAYLPNTEN